MAPRQLFDRGIPLATTTLSLFLEFDLSAVADYAQLPSRDHAAAAQLACKVTGLRPHSCVVARACTTEKAATVAEAQRLPFYSDAFLTDPKHEIRLVRACSLAVGRWKAYFLQA